MITVDELKTISFFAEVDERLLARMSATHGKQIFLIGDGNSAGQAAMFFSSYATSVTLLVRGPDHR